MGSALGGVVLTRSCADRCALHAIYRTATRRDHTSTMSATAQVCPGPRAINLLELGRQWHSDLSGLWNASRMSSWRSSLVPLTE